MSLSDQKKDHCAERRPPFECTALLLQGGGALGAYQAGVYEALSEAGIHPDWVAGISIGAVNSAIIAGNPAEKRVEGLRRFWERIASARAILSWARSTNGLEIGASENREPFRVNGTRSKCAPITPRAA